MTLKNLVVETFEFKYTKIIYRFFKLFAILFSYETAEIGNCALIGNLANFAEMTTAASIETPAANID